MGQVCKICNNSERLSIDRALLSGAPVRQISTQYQVSASGLRRHKATHLSRQLMKADENRKMFESKSLGEEVRNLVDRTKKILKRSEKKGLDNISLAAIRELRQTYSFMAELALTLQDRQEDREERHMEIRRQADLLKNLPLRDLRRLKRIYERAGIGTSVISSRRYSFRDRDRDESDFMDLEPVKVRHKIRSSRSL